MTNLVSWLYQVSMINFLSYLQIRRRIKDFFVWENMDPNYGNAVGDLYKV